MEKTINIAIIGISIAVVFLCLSLKMPDGYRFMFLHPLLYALFFLKCEPFKKAKFSRASLLVLFLTMFIRYVISPLLLILGGFPPEDINDPACINKGILLMTYEEFLVLLLISIYGRKLTSQVNDETGANYKVLINNPFYTFIILLGALVLIMLPEVLNRYHFLLNLTGSEYDMYNENTAYAYSLLVDVARYILVLILISYFARKYNNNFNSKYIAYSVLVIGLNMMFVHDISRFSILIPTIVLTYMILQLYPKYRGKILRMVLVLGILAIAYTTFIKMFAEARGGSEKSDNLAAWAATIQQYFMGQREVGIGLYVADKIPSFEIGYMFNDMISNVILLNKLYVPVLSSITLYNYEYNNGPWVDKIFPNLCAGYTYFGYLLSPLITFFFVYLSLKFDLKSYTERRVEYKFLWVYAAIMCGFIMMQWYPMIVCILINVILVMYVIFRVNDMLFRKSA